MDNDPVAALRIGELSRRLGVSDHVLRAWERRYGLLQPVRTAGGFRLYTTADEARVRRMLAHLEKGLSAAEAARAALAEDQPAAAIPALAPLPESIDGHGALAPAATALRDALDDLDEPRAQEVLDHLFAQFTIETVLRDVVLPHLHDLGERWANGEVSVAYEHFASNLLRGRMASLARGWGHGSGPRAVLACLPGEQHDLALLAFGIALNRAGWRVSFLGASTPVGEIARVAGDVGARLVVVTATTAQVFTAAEADLARLAGEFPVAIAGAGASPEIAAAAGATLLTADPVTSAAQLTPG
jgi:DNA-binding transcriptional MerR regulator